jgi:c(7)-type cytochrome triheme protein
VKIVRVITLVLTILIAVVFVSSAMAVGTGKTVEYAGGKEGKVVFDGKTHADKGTKCNDCHPKVFQMKKGSAKITSPHKAGEFCGTCHDGKKAFGDQDKADCGKCHKKAAGGY